MGKFIDLTNKQFDKLFVEERIEDYISSGGNKFVQYRCRCECGNHKNVVAHKLRTGHTKSCGSCNAFDTFIDLTGKQFDKLFVIQQNGYHMYPNGDKDFKWLCQCECGEQLTVSGKVLKTNGNHSCDKCFRHQRKIVDTMLNKKFGRLTVKNREKDIFTAEGTVVDMWLCECECTNTVVVRGASLRNGHTSSCGCYRSEMLNQCSYTSKSEMTVIDMLERFNIEYEQQKTYHGLIGVSGNLLSYDFCIVKDDTHFLIECQGLQHYEPVEFFGGKKSFGIQRIHDARKHEYAVKNNYPLLILNCSKYNEQYIQQEVSKFLKL